MQSIAKRRAQPPSILIPLGLLLGAAALSLIAGWQCLRFAATTPLVRAELLYATPSAQKRVRDTLGLAIRNASSEAREGYVLSTTSNLFVAALFGQRDAYSVEHEMAQSVRELPSTRFGQVQLLAIRLLALDRAGQSPAEKWTSVRPILESCRSGSLDPHQRPLIAAWNRAYTALRVAPGTAATLAERLVGQPHGPLLQYLTGNLIALAAARRDAGDAAGAELCRETLIRLLRPLVIDPNPPGLRLLAADLLARTLESLPGDSDAAEAERIVAALRLLRREYHAAVDRLPNTIFGLESEAALAPVEHERLVFAACQLMWLAGGGSAAAAVTLVLFWTLFTKRRGGCELRPAGLRAIAIAALLLLAGSTWPLMQPDAVRSELRADFSSLRYIWWQPAYALLVGLVALTATALTWPRADAAGEKSAPGTAAVRIAGVAMCAWLLLAGMTLLFALSAGQTQQQFERTVAAASQDSLAAILGPAATGPLETLRAWKP